MRFLEISQLGHLCCRPAKKITSSREIFTKLGTIWPIIDNNPLMDRITMDTPKISCQKTLIIPVAHISSYALELSAYILSISLPDAFIV
jgi:hypothetical protein